MERRDLLKGILIACVAPAIIKVERLMPVKAIVTPQDPLFWTNHFVSRTASYNNVTQEMVLLNPVNGDIMMVEQVSPKESIYMGLGIPLVAGIIINSQRNIGQSNWFMKSKNSFDSAKYQIIGTKYFEGSGILSGGS